MAQNVIINGVTYNSVPRVEIPLSGSGGGKAVFVDTSDATLDTGDKMLSSYTSYANGTKYTGTIVTKSGSDVTVSGPTVTAPAGYYATSVSATIPDATLTASGTGSASVSSLTFTYDSQHGKFVASGSGAISGTATAAVGSAGYVASNATATGSVSGSASVSVDVPVITGGVTTTGSVLFTPTISRTDATATGATNVGTGTASTTAPSSGYFVSVKSSAATQEKQFRANITTAGYGTSTANNIVGEMTIGARASDVTYVTVAGGTAKAPTTISGTAATVSTGTNTITLTKSVSVTPTVTAGYVTSGTATSSSVSLTASVTTKAAATITPTTSDQTIAAGTYLTGAQTIKGDANLQAAYIASGVTIFGVTGTLSSPVISQDGTTKVLSIS